MSSPERPPPIPPKTKGWIMIEKPEITYFEVPAPCSSNCPSVGDSDIKLHNSDCPNATLCKKCGSNLSVKFVERLKYPMCCRPPVRSLI